MKRIVVYFISIGLLTMASTGWGQEEGSAAAPPTAQQVPSVGQAKENVKANAKANTKGKKVTRPGKKSSLVQPTRPAQAQAPAPARAPRPSPSRGRVSDTEASAATLATCPQCLANAQAACARYGQDSKGCATVFGRAPAAGSLPKKEVKEVDSGQ